MVQYEIGETMTPLQSEKAPNACVLTLVTSKELQQNLRIPGLEMLLRHTPKARRIPVSAKRKCIAVIFAERLSHRGAPKSNARLHSAIFWHRAMSFFVTIRVWLIR